MTTIKRAQRVPYAASQLYALVNDIPAYRSFVPWCYDSDVLSQTGDTVIGRLSFRKAGLEKSFTTENHLSPPNRIDIQLHDGPFDQLEGHWLFKAEGENSCLVVLELTFSFSSTLIEHVFGPLFHQIANRLVDTFCHRAEVIYGGKNT